MEQDNRVTSPSLLRRWIGPAILGIGWILCAPVMGQGTPAPSPSVQAPKLPTRLTAGDPSVLPPVPSTPAPTPLPSQGSFGNVQWKQSPAGDGSLYEVTKQDGSAPVLVDEGFLRKQMANPGNAGIADKLLGGYPPAMGRMTDDMLNTHFPSPSSSNSDIPNLGFPAQHGNLTATADSLVPGYIRLEGTDAEGNPVARTIPLGLYKKAVEAGGSESALVSRLLQIPMQVPESIRGKAQHMSREEFLAAIVSEGPLAKHPAVRVAVANHALTTVDTTGILRAQNRDRAVTTTPALNRPTQPSGTPVRPTRPMDQPGTIQESTLPPLPESQVTSKLIYGIVGILVFTVAAAGTFYFMRRREP